MEELQKLDDSGYKGFGFKYSPVEWRQKMSKLIAQGRTETQAKAELIASEEIARQRQKIAQEEQVGKKRAA